MSDKIIKDFTGRILKLLNKKKYKKIHPLHEPLILKDDLKDLKNCINRGEVSSIGKQRLLFEKSLKKLTGAKYVTLTSSGSTALHTVLSATKANNDCEILIPNLNYIASVNAVLTCKAIPHFIDTEKNSPGIDISKLEIYLNKIAKIKKNKCINIKTKKTIHSCIVLHPFGYPCDIERVKKLLKKWKILLIEDTAEALGSYYNSKHLGTFGHCSILSFNGNKIITTGGGGAILTSNRKFHKLVSHISTTAKIKHQYIFSHDQHGFNYRLPNLNCALGLTQVKKLGKILKSKKRLHNAYTDSFKNANYLKVYNSCSDRNKNYSNHWLNIAILNKKFEHLRNKIIENSMKNKVQVRPSWETMHSIKYLRGFPKMNLQNSISFNRRVICLPSSPDYFYK